MCFRPADIDKPPFLCSECGEEISETFGVFPKVCPFCSHEFSDEELAAAQGGSPVAAPGASAPDAPKPPTAPGAPKPPSVPKPPSA